jgi:hypothetical protein
VRGVQDAIGVRSYGTPTVPPLVCPHCAEPFETYPDPGGGEDQDYVEDCAVCCRPVRLHARYDDESGEYLVSISAEP